MPIIRSNDPNIKYVQVDLGPILDPNISYGAKGLSGFLDGHPEGVTLEFILEHSKEKKTRVCTLLRELESAGYIRWEK